MPDTFTRKFTIGPGSTMKKTALDTILKDLEQRNANGRHVIAHEFLASGSEVAITFEAVDVPDPEE